MIDEQCVASVSEGMVLYCVSFLDNCETECIFEEKIFDEKAGTTLYFPGSMTK